DVAVAIEGDAVVGIRQVLGGEPEIQRMLRDEIERHSRHERRSAGRQRYRVELPYEGDVPHRVRELVVAEVEVVDRERLLKDGRVWNPRDGQQHRVDVAHVVTADDVRGISETARMTIGGGAQQQRRRIDRAAGRHDDVGAEHFFYPVETV